jgi:hypothetical protein
MALSFTTSFQVIVIPGPAAQSRNDEHSDRYTLP